MLGCSQYIQTYIYMSFYFIFNKLQITTTLLCSRICSGQGKDQHTLSLRPLLTFCCPNEELGSTDALRKAGEEGGEGRQGCLASSLETINGPNDWRRRGLSVGLTSKKTPIPLPTRHATAWLGSEERFEGTEAWQASGHSCALIGPPSEAFLKRKCKWYFH